MAVYTEVDDDEISAFLSNYDVGELMSFKGIAEGVENTNYILHTTTGPFILTLYEKRVSAADLPFFLGLMEHLSKNGVNCPTPVRDRNGNNLGSLSGRNAALVTFLEGFCIHRPKPDHCAQVGRALAQLHLAGSDYKQVRRNGLSVSGWSALFEQIKEDADTISDGIKALIETELAALKKSWPQNLPQGTIHADLFPDNVFFLSNQLSGLIDFYFACTDALAYDIAVCLNAWCFDPDYSFNAEKGRALLHAYHDQRPLSSNEQDAMPTLARGAALRFLLTRCYDWLNTPDGAVVTPHNPIDYVHRLKFHQGIKTIHEFGFETIDR